MAEELSSTDYTVLWVSFACMFFSFVVFYITLKMQPVGKRLFHAYTCGIVGFASTAYLFMALGGGYIYVRDDTEIFQYARYIDWLFTTPLLLLDLAGLAGVPMEDQVMLVILDILMILAGFAGGVASTSTTALLMWLLGCIFFVPIVYDLIVTFSKCAKEVGDAAGKTYGQLMWLTVAMWVCYPIVFFVTEFHDWLGLTGETICYCILDVIAKCGFGFILLFSKQR